MSSAMDLLNKLSADAASVHSHTVVDSDNYFVINPDTRKISNVAGVRNTLMQYDHNSEVYTFELPRYVEEHDMALCNRVRLHYINIGSGSNKNASVVEMHDLAVNSEDPSKVISTWTITREATQIAGTLNFLIQYMCVDSDGNVIYEWHTDIYTEVDVKTGMNNGEQVMIERSLGTENANRYLVTDEDGNVTVGGTVMSEESTSGIPDYITAEITAVADTLTAVQKTHPKSATFAFLTDHHFHYNSEHLVRHNLYAIDEISKLCRVEFAAFGGDNIAESGQDHDYALNMLEYFGNILRDYGTRIVTVKGNHDDNTLSGYTTVGTYPMEYILCDSEFYAHLNRHNENVFNISMDSNRDRLYYYIDLPSQQIRVIFLNVIDIPITDDGTGELVYKGCRDSGYSNEQLNWVVNDALDFSDKKHPEQWGVITVQHFTDCPDIADFSDDRYVTQDHGGKVMYRIFQAFQNREVYGSAVTEGDFVHNVSCDFTDARAEMICRITGHTHADRHVMHNNILYLSTMAAGKNGVGNGEASDGNTYTKTEDSSEESAFDFFTVDKDTKTIYITRFGAGEDRAISWCMAQTETLETVAIKYNGSFSPAGWINHPTFEYTTDGTNNNYGPAVAKQSIISGGLLRVDWDVDVAIGFSLNLYLFDSDGNPYKWAGLSADTAMEHWSGELYEPTYLEPETVGSWGVAVAPFSVQIPDGCTCMCAMRWVPGTAGSPNGSLTDATAFQTWVLDGGLTFTVTK